MSGTEHHHGSDADHGTGTMPSCLMLRTDDPARGEYAHQLAEKLGLLLVTDTSELAPSICLVVTEGRLELRDGRLPRSRPVFADLIPSELRSYRRSPSRRQPLARAIGARTKTVVDATAGLGGDTALLVGWGYKVTAVERNAVLAELLADGLRRACLDPDHGSAWKQRLAIVHSEARVYLRDCPEKSDAVYLDPMYPPKSKISTLAKQRIRLVRELVGDDADSPNLLEEALGHARHRVVVKRPLRAKPLLPNPVASFQGKLARYDLYTPPQQAD